MEHEKLIPFFQKMYFPREMQSEDMLQAGRIGLFLASRKWKPELGAFTTYASYWVRRETTRFLRERRFLHHKNGFRKCEYRPSIESMDAPLFEDTTLHDVIATEPTQEALVLEFQARARVQRAVDTLEPKTQQIVRMWMDDVSMEEIGKEVGLTRQGVSHAFKVARKKLEKRLAA